MKTALVTGASGFVGRNLTKRLLERGCSVRCLVRPTSSVCLLRRWGAELVLGDVTDPASLSPAVAGVDTVFHSAGLTRALHEADLMRVNAWGTGNIARACAQQANPPVLVYVSSLAAAGPVARGQVRRETDVPAPVSHYGRSKLAGERAVTACADSVPITILRPGIVIGPWDREMLPMFRSIRWLRVHAIPTFAPPPISLIHVDELVDWLIAAAEHGQRLVGTRGNGQEDYRGTYFACMPEHPTLTELGRMIGRAVHRRSVLLLHLVQPLPWLVAGINESIGRIRKRPMVVNWDKIREATAASWAASPDAALRDLAPRPPRPLEQQLQAAAQWYLERGWL